MCSSPTQAKTLSSICLKAASVLLHLIVVKKDFHDLLKEIGRRELNNGGIRDADTEHVVMWMGDIVVLYIRKIPGGKDAGNLEVYFPDLTNLHCITHDIGKNYTPVSPF